MSYALTFLAGMLAAGLAFLWMVWPESVDWDD